MDDKICITCKDPKPKSNFRNSKRSKDGLDSVCKDCQLIIRTEKKNKNIDVKKQNKISSALKIVNGPWRINNEVNVRLDQRNCK